MPGGRKPGTKSKIKHKDREGGTQTTYGKNFNTKETQIMRHINTGTNNG